MYPARRSGAAARRCRPRSARVSPAGWSEALAPLGTGVLVLGSGHVTHNLRDWMRHHADPEPLPYARAFADWLADATEVRRPRGTGRLRAPSPRRGHPTEEHCPFSSRSVRPVPVREPERVHAAIEGGALAMDALAARAA